MALDFANKIDRPRLNSASARVTEAYWKSSKISSRVADSTKDRYDAALLPLARTKAIHVTVLCAFLLLVGCTFNPKNETRIGSILSSVFVSGFGPLPGTDFEVIAARGPTGPWTHLATLTTKFTRFTTSKGNFFPYSGYVSVPSDLWDEIGCDRVSYLRIRTRSTKFKTITFDERSPDGRFPEQCIGEELRSRGGLISAINICRSPDSPNIRITAPGPSARHRGDLVLTTVADVAAQACLERIDGDLTIAGPNNDISLPRLREIRGDLNIDYPVHTNPSFVDEDEAYSRDFPKLRTVLGSIDVSTAASSPSQYISLDLGMNRVTQVDGDITVVLEGFNKTVRGLNLLRRVGGDLTVTAPGNDFSPFDFLNSLSNIDGSLNVNIGNSFPRDLLRGLTFIGGSVEVRATTISSDMLQSLSTVEGDLALGGSSTSPLSYVEIGAISRVLPQLGSVGEHLSVEHTSGVARDFDVGMRSLSAGALTIQNTGQTSFTNTNLQIVGSGEIRIENNAMLCQSAIDAFLSGQSAWTGTAATSGNNDGC